MATLPDHVERAIRVYKKLRRFMNACNEFLWIDDWPMAGQKAQMAGLQKFEGVPNVYPVAFSLLKEIGDGSGPLITWLPDDCDPKLCSAIQHIAQHARYIVWVEWGWPQGYTAEHLRALVMHRKQTGMPTSKRRMDEFAALLDQLTPEQRAEAEAGLPGFDAEVPAEKREQFDRIVALHDAWLTRWHGMPWKAPGRGPREKEQELESFKWFLFEHEIDKLDQIEERETCRVEGRKYVDPEETEEGRRSSEAWMKEYDDYENAPLIGKKAATITRRTLFRLDDFAMELYFAVRKAKKLAEREAQQGMAVGPTLAERFRSEYPNMPDRVAFLELIEGKDCIPVGIVARKIHGCTSDAEITTRLENTIRTALRRLNNRLLEMGENVSFKLLAGMIHRRDPIEE